MKSIILVGLLAITPPKKCVIIIKNIDKLMLATISFPKTVLNFLSNLNLKMLAFFHNRIAISHPDTVVPTAGAR